jgi:hypothetical protein
MSPGGLKAPYFLGAFEKIEFIRRLVVSHLFKEHNFMISARNYVCPLPSLKRVSKNVVKNMAFVRVCGPKMAAPSSTGAAAKKESVLPFVTTNF